MNSDKRAGVSAVDVWRGAIASRLPEVVLGFPADLAGAIQFLPTSGEPFCCLVAGRSTAFAPGIAPRIDTLVVIDTAALGGALAGTCDAAAAFNVSGDTELYRRLFAAISAEAPAQTALSLRQTARPTRVHTGA